MTTTLEENQRWVSAFNSSTTVTIPPYAVLEPYSAALESDYIIGGSSGRIVVEVAAADSIEEELPEELPESTIDPETEETIPPDITFFDPCDLDRNPFDPYHPTGDPYDPYTERFSGYQTRSEHMCFNGPLPILPGGLGHVTFQLPALARVCPFDRDYGPYDPVTVFAFDGTEWLQVMRDEFNLRPRHPMLGGIVGPSIFWFLEVLEVVDDVGICLVSRRAYGII